MLVSCSPVATLTTLHASSRPSFDARLRALGTNSVIQGAAAHRLAFASGDPETLATSIRASGASSGSVREVLSRDVDDVVIVAWLVSSSTLGAWTAYNPRSDEKVGIPVSDMPGLVTHSKDGFGVYRLRDGKHLMLVEPVVVGDETVGAVGFILSDRNEYPELEGEAVQLS
jgi:hypothetical protein